MRAKVDALGSRRRKRRLPAPRAPSWPSIARNSSLRRRAEMRSPEIVRRADRATMRPLWTTKRPRRPLEIAPGDHAASDAKAASMI